MEKGRGGSWNSIILQTFLDFFGGGGERKFQGRTTPKDRHIMKRGITCGAQREKKRKERERGGDVVVVEEIMKVEFPFYLIIFIFIFLLFSHGGEGMKTFEYKHHLSFSPSASKQGRLDSQKIHATALSHRVAPLKRRVDALSLAPRRELFACLTP